MMFGLVAIFSLPELLSRLFDGLPDLRRFSNFYLIACVDIFPFMVNCEFSKYMSGWYSKKACMDKLPMLKLIFEIFI